MNARNFTPVVVMFALAITSMLAYSSGVTNKVFLFLFSGYGTSVAQETGTSKAVFTVKCYDDGKAALQGLKGVQKIETGFFYLNETDAVYYDAEVIMVEEGNSLEEGWNVRGNGEIVESYAPEKSLEIDG
jgi:hypothetical protein